MHYFILTLNTFVVAFLLFYIFNKFTKISFDYFCILLLLLLLFYCIVLFFVVFGMHATRLLRLPDMTCPTR